MSGGEPADGERAPERPRVAAKPVLTLVDLVEDHEMLHELRREVEELRAIVGKRGMSVKEAAEAEGVCERTIRRQIDAGELQHRRIGSRIVVYLERKSALRISSNDGT